ncbi:hypothetical protein [Streptomyces sp. HUAS ZL42]|uniref:hypothetical protein n=1 Tax=Streptomyces sp. HUAS ZL42 TaxID=3231715 RepID=UPI00345E1EED
MNSYTPRIGDLVWDGDMRKIGRVMDKIGPYWQLKPPGGGREWDAHGALRPATAAERRSVGGAQATTVHRCGDAP